MTSQPEHILELNLIAQLEKLGYEKAVIKDESDLLINLKSQLEKHNKVKLLIMNLSKSSITSTKEMFLSVLKY